jgi:hypothetical protein
VRFAAALLISTGLNAATFYRDVVPILQRHCQNCHRQGEIGPMPLLTYAQTRPWAKAIRDQVLLGKMPPWFAQTEAVKFENDPRLSADEIATLREWVDSRAPAGKAADAPPPMGWTKGWNIQSPDLVVSVPEPIPVPAREEMDYRYVIIPLHLAKSRWVEAAEIRPGARAVVHHAVAYIRAPGDPWLRDAPVGKSFARPGTTKADILAIYAPGQPASVCRTGMARLIPAGSDLVLQMHYTPSGRAVDDRTSIGLVWSKQEPSQRVLTLQIGTTDLHIPAGDPDYKVSASGTLPHDALLLSMFPHLHLRGKAFEYSVIEPDGRYTPLLRVAPYRFEWQLNYRLAAPLMLRKGTRLRCTAWYDNSVNNPRNPDASIEVGYGEQSRDEMMVGFFDVAVPASMDKQRFFEPSPPSSATSSSLPPTAR